jgi:hypothetical protein
MKIAGKARENRVWDARRQSAIMTYLPAFLSKECAGGQLIAMGTEACIHV